MEVDVPNVLQGIPHARDHLHTNLMPFGNADFRANHQVDVQQDIVPHATAAKFMNIAYAIRFQGNGFQHPGIIFG